MDQKQELFVLKETLEEQMNNGIGMPVMTRNEARAAGLHFYWTGRPCGRGHHSKRRVLGGACMACTTIQSKASKQRYKEREKVVKVAQAAARPIHVLKFKEQQKVLEAYSRTGSLEEAAKVVKLTLPELNVQIAKVDAFGIAVYNLEKRLKAMAAEEGYKPSEDLWDQAKRDLFITAYVDTGDVASAREAVKVSASVYHKELERNPDFAKAVKEAKPKADLALEEKAIQLALRGNDKLLTLVLKAKLPEYKDKIQIEQNTTVKLDDKQLNFRLNSLISRYIDTLDAIEGEVVDGPRLIENGKGGQGSFAPALGGVGSSEDVQQVPVHVPGQGTPEPAQLPEAP